MQSSLTNNTKNSQSNSKVQTAWAMYDWANSAYNLVITSTIFPAYYIAITTQKDGNDVISFFGNNIKNSSLFDYALAVSYLIIALISPILSAIADYKGNKKRFLQFFCYLGSLACCGLYFFDVRHLELGIILFILAAIGYCGSLVFYNAYLPEIAPDNEQDALSAKGFSYGYIGSVLLQIICLLFVMKPEWFGIQDDSFAPRLSFLLVGIWWMGWAQIPFKRLPRGATLETKRDSNIFTAGFIELKKVWHQLQKLPLLKTFLAAFFFYSMGVQTVMLAATIFGTKVLHLNTGALITTILIIQVVAIAGSFIMSKLSAQIGNLQVLLITVGIWVIVCIAAYFTTTAIEFYIVATIVGFIMGGIQSLSRSTYARLMPETKDTASFFSFYDITEKIAIVLGMFFFGLIEQLLSSMRYSILALVVFFIIGAAVLFIAIRKQSSEMALH